MRKMDFKDLWSKTEISSFEEINDLAEEVITTLKFDLFEYDQEGNLIKGIFESAEYGERMKDFYSHPEDNWLYFAENPNFRKYSFRDALDMSFADIKELYLKDILPIARAIMRKDPQWDYGRHVADNISDDVLDNFLILRWKENLKLWTAQWERKKGHQIDFGASKTEVERKDIPYYDPYSQLWKVEVDGRKEEGSILYVVSEFVKDGLCYRFKHIYKAQCGEQADFNHEHTFSGVVACLIDDARNFSIEGFEEDYSAQEIELLVKIKDKFLQLEA